MAHRRGNVMRVCLYVCVGMCVWVCVSQATTADASIHRQKRMHFCMISHTHTHTHTHTPQELEDAIDLVFEQALAQRSVCMGLWVWVWVWVWVYGWVCGWSSRPWLSGQCVWVCVFDMCLTCVRHEFDMCFHFVYVSDPLDCRSNTKTCYRHVINWPPGAAEPYYRIVQTKTLAQSGLTLCHIATVNKRQLIHSLTNQAINKPGKNMKTHDETMSDWVGNLVCFYNKTSLFIIRRLLLESEMKG